MTTSFSTSFKNLTNIFSQISFNNISALNYSNVSTMITGNESLIMTSIRKNNKAKSFQKKSHKLKNYIQNIKRMHIEHYSYKNLILQKSLINTTKKEKVPNNLPLKKRLIFEEFYDKIKKNSFVAQKSHIRSSRTL